MELSEISDEKILENLTQVGKLSDGITIITGAGVSKASGLNTFRGKGGYYQNHSAEELASRSGFMNNPKLVWQWYRDRMRAVFAAKPNQTHYAIVELENMGLLNKIITQNVDGLHHMAGNSSDKIIEMHGRITESHCFQNCGYRIEWDHAPEHIPVECKCGALQRPSVVWFGESLDPEKIEQAEEAILTTKLLIVIGTSGVVYPVAIFPKYAINNNIPVYEFNTEKTILSDYVTYTFIGPAEITFPKFVKLLAENIK